MARPPATLAARKIHADALMVEGDPRGEFIALQCWAAEASPDVDVADWSRRRLRSERLLARHRLQWIRDAAEALGLEPRFATGKFVFRGGFIERLDTWSVTAAEGEWLAANTAVEDVRVSQAAAEALATTSLWGHLRALQCSGSTMNDVLNEENTEHLEVLNLNECGAVRNLTALAALPLPSVVEVGLRGLGLSARSLRKLCGSAWLPSLRRLDVGATHLHAAALQQLTSHAPRLSGLRIRSVSALADHLADWTNDRPWQELDLRSSWGARDVDAMTSWDTSALRIVDLSSPRRPLTPPDVERLACGWTVPALRELTFSNTRMGDASLGLLAAAGWFARTHALVLRSNSLETAGVEHVVAADPPCSVLDLSSNKLDDDALAVLASWPGLSRVTALDLSQNRRVTAEGLFRLLSSPHLAAPVIDVEGLGTDARCEERLVELRAG